MATLTGIVEEVTFRGQLIPTFAENFGGGNLLVGTAISTFLFAILHTNPLSLIKPSSQDAFVDNFVLLLLQLINGSIFAVLFLTTENLIVPIVAHALYDFYTFYKTHLVDVAGQMEYANRNTSLMPAFTNPQIEQQWTKMRGSQFVTEAKRTFFLNGYQS